MKKLSKIIIFLVLFFLIYQRIVLILIPKNFTGNWYPTTSTYSDFYELEGDTVDVIFLGSSVAVCAFVPEELYSKYRITSYSLACEQQNLFTSYYWLEEAWQYQKPQIVVLDVAMLYLFDAENMIGTRGSLTRRAFDFMRWSPVKIKAALHMKEVDESLTTESIVFPTIQYRERLKSINSNDFQIEQLGQESLWKGHLPLEYYAGVEGFKPITEEMTLQDAENRGNEYMLAYLDRIVAFCEEKGIELLLTMGPMTIQSVDRHCFLTKYADEKHIQFVDFNLESVYVDSDLDFYVDCHDNVHCNFSGALKITDYIGGIIHEKIGPSTGDTEEWEKFLPEYEEYVSTVKVKKYE